MTQWAPALEHRWKPGAWWEGKRVRLLCEITTRCGHRYSKRMIFTVTRKWGGLDVSRPGGRIKGLLYRQCEVKVTTSFTTPQSDARPGQAAG